METRKVSLFWLSYEGKAPVSQENGNNGPISKPVNDTPESAQPCITLTYAVVSSSELKMQDGTSGIPESWENRIPEGGVVVSPRLMLLRGACSFKKK